MNWIKEEKNNAGSVKDRMMELIQESDACTIERGGHGAAAGIPEMVEELRRSERAKVKAALNREVAQITQKREIIAKNAHKINERIGVITVSDSSTGYKVRP